MMTDELEEKEVIRSVRELYQRQEWAKKLFESLSQRKNNPATTNIDRLMRLLDVPLSEATAIAKELQDAGCGTYIVGRKGNPSRFAWDYSAITLGLVATGKSDEIIGMTDEASGDEREDIINRPTLASTIQEAKEALARSLGITPDQIEIIIKT
ncbi:hypothetical protein [Xanthobacter versatilis]|uniref:hypothetical protein n=1 Tax=Xanthobacter autotrophicus (strain ATCC BAA-1158 / Py2) TaxID=78245 RepID=UPI0037277641